MKSDVIYETAYDGAINARKHCVRSRPVLRAVFLTSTETASRSHSSMDGVAPAHARRRPMAARSEYWREKDAEVVGMLGSGGMAKIPYAGFHGSCDASGSCQVYSPTRENREAFFGREMAQACYRGHTLRSPRRHLQGGRHRAA